MEQQAEADDGLRKRRNGQDENHHVSFPFPCSEAPKSDFATVR